MASNLHIQPEESEKTFGNNSELVSESLLSFAKDFRYLHQCRSLIEQAIKPTISHNHRTDESKIQWFSWFLSCVLYILIVIRPSGRTLGMEVAGLKLKSERRKNLIRLLLSTTVGWFSLDYVVNRLDSNDPTEIREDLRGNDRIAMHQTLRMQMLERAASQNSQSPSANNPRYLNPQNFNTMNSNTMNPSLKRILSVFRYLMKSTTEAFSQPEGPHSLINQRTSSTRISVLTWILRLHMAHFCVVGNHPTIIHRLLRLEHTYDGRKAIIFQPKTNRIVALLIGIQASATFARFLLNWSAKRTAEYLESRRTINTSTAPIQKYFKFQNLKKRKSKAEADTICAICRLDRDHPAAPSTCGHVFCWSCLQQWVSNNQACPLCRTPCRTQDILALYKYIPSQIEKA